MQRQHISQADVKTPSVHPILQADHELSGSVVAKVLDSMDVHGRLTLEDFVAIADVSFQIPSHACLNCPSVCCSQEAKDGFDTKCWCSCRRLSDCGACSNHIAPDNVCRCAGRGDLCRHTPSKVDAPQLLPPVVSVLEHFLPIPSALHEIGP